MDREAMLGFARKRRRSEGDCKKCSSGKAEEHQETPLRFILFGHCERSEAIQLPSFAATRRLDCFVASLLAMTAVV
jgi:hypothetical protein